MKKHLIPMTLALLMFTLLTGCAASAAPQNTQFPLNEQNGMTNVNNVTPVPNATGYASPSPDQITQDEAKDIALKHAGFTADQVQFLRTEYEFDERVPHYDISFRADRLEYEYDIHAKTGEILAFETDN